MARTYTLLGDNMTVVNAVVTLAFLNPPATGPDTLIRRIWVSNTGTVAFRQRLQLVTQVTAFPTLVSATPKAHAMHDTASNITGNTTGAAGTCGINASAEGAGTKTVAHADVFDVAVGFLKVLTPEDVYEMDAGSSSGFGVYFPAATGASPNTLGWMVGVTYSEV